MKSTRKVATASAAQRITERIRELRDWRGERLAQVRALIHEAVAYNREHPPKRRR